MTDMVINKTFKYVNYIIDSHQHFNGMRYVFKFPNGYGASLINITSLYKIIEIAVLGLDGHITYDTEVTNDVVQLNTLEELLETLDAIYNLKPLASETQPIVGED